MCRRPWLRARAGLGKLSEQGDVEAGRQIFAAVRAEQCFAMPAVGADVDGHVFQYAQNGNVDLAEHIHSLARVYQRDVLRRGYDDGPGYGDALGQRELDVARAGGRSMKR